MWPRIPGRGFESHQGKDFSHKFLFVQFMNRRVELSEEAELKKQLHDCLHNKRCVPIVMTLLIEDFVREAQELRQLSQQPRGD